MGELQATAEFSVELYKFYNVDLFQRGFYQIRASLRLSPRLTSKVEVCLPNNNSEKSIQSSSQLVFPACIVTGTAVSKTFQILYRNEEVTLNDVMLFKAHIIVDSKKIEETLQKADFQLVVELWFTENSFGQDQHNSIQCVSSRILKFHLCPTKGLHHHLPVLFDYFHLSAVSVTVHGCLLAIHQPYVNVLRPGKPTWLTNSPKVGNRFQSSASLESVLFGGNAVMKPSPSLTRLSQARSVHQNICTLLLSSYESLQSKLIEYMNLLPPWQQLQIEVTDCYTKLERLREITKSMEAEDELLAVVNSDIAQLCAENIILWQQFLEAFVLKDRIQQHLAREHHMQRVKRFAEGFFVIENSRQSIFHCAEQSYQTYLSISESIRKTKYFSTLPSLGVECIDMDGSSETLPVIFEDHYQDLAKHKNGHSHINTKSRGAPVSVNEISLQVAKEEIANLHKPVNGSSAEVCKCNSGKSEHRRPHEGKKEKNVGCFTAITPKSSMSSDDLCYGGSKRSVKGSSSIDKSLSRIRQNEMSTVDRYRVPPKTSISVEELARIKEDYKLRVLESKLYRVVPDMPPPPPSGGSAKNEMSQSSRQEMFKARNSKSLSAVEEFRGHVRFHALRSCAIPRLETVPILSPLWQLEPRRPPRLEELRLQKAKLDISTSRFEAREAMALDGAQLLPTKNLNTGVDSSQSTNPVGVAAQPKTNNNPGKTPVTSPNAATPTSRLQEPDAPAGNGRPPPKSALQEAKLVEVSEKHHGDPACEPARRGHGQPKANKDGLPQWNYNVRNVDGSSEESAAKPNGASETREELGDSGESREPLRSKLKDLKLDLLSVSDMCHRAYQAHWKVGANVKRKLNGLQFLHTLKNQSPTGSSSSDSVVLMGYKKLEQSESLPAGLSWVGRMAAIAADQKHSGHLGTERMANDYCAKALKKRSVALHCSHASVSLPNVSVLNDEAGGVSDDKSLVGSESMPDLGGDSATHDDFSVSSFREGKENPNCQWSSSDSFVVVAPRATAEVSDDDDQDQEGSAEDLEIRNEYEMKDGIRKDPHLDEKVLSEILAKVVANNAKKEEEEEEEEKGHRGSNGGGTDPGRKKHASTSPISDSVLGPYPKQRRGRRSSSSSSSSTSTSERSGWVSSQRSTSDTTSSDGTKESPSSSPQSSERQKHSKSEVESYLTKSSGVEDEDTGLLSSYEEERHIYEEIHLPPEEFRDPPTAATLPLSPSDHSSSSAFQRSRPDLLAHKATVPHDSSKCKPHCRHHLHLNGSSSSSRHSPNGGSTAAPLPTDACLSSNSFVSHQRLASSSSRETGYSSDRQTSKEEICNPRVIAGVHRSKLRTHSRCMNSVHAEHGPHCHRSKSRSKRRDHALAATTAYMETKCTVLEMISDATFRDYEDRGRHRWTVGSKEDGVDDDAEDDDEEDEVARVPAPPPPAPRNKPALAKDGHVRDEHRTPSSTTEGDADYDDKSSSSTLVAPVGFSTIKEMPDVMDHLCCSFVKAKEEFKRQLNLQAFLYSDCPMLASTIPYFHVSEDFRLASSEGLHLVICVHGLDGNSADLRLVKTYLELGLPCSNLEFLMSERNQGDTFSDFEKMTDKLVAEILYHIEVYRIDPVKISFIGHSLGNIIIRSALVRPQMKPLLKKLHTFLSLSGPHLGTLYNSSGLVNMGLWFMQKWKKSGSLLQLSMKDATDIRRTFLYKLSQKPGLEYFRNILLFGSSQDRYVPIHSARIELCKAAIKDTSTQGAAYRDMVHGLLQPVARNPNITFVRYDVHHALPNTANSLIGRAAHIAVLDSELFIEKFLTVCGLKYFK